MCPLSAKNVLIDPGHNNEPACIDALKTKDISLVISHTGCRALADIPRNKSDKELRTLADLGGVAGICLMLFLRINGHTSADNVIAHIEHAINVCGEDQVGIGSDNSPTSIDDLGTYRAFMRGEVQRRRIQEKSTADEMMDSVPLIPDLTGPSRFQKIAEKLESRGHGPRRIEKISGENFYRLMQDSIH